MSIIESMQGSAGARVPQIFFLKKQENPRGGELYLYVKHKYQYKEMSIMGKFTTGCLGLIGIVLVMGLIGSCAGGGNKDKTTAPASSNSSSTTQQQPKQKVYAEADINVLLSEAKDNAAAANKNYKGKDVKIVGGHVDNIDSDVRYITIDGTAANYTMIHISCDVDSKNQELKDTILALRKKQGVTVYGTITDVGDIMGYKLKLDKIEPAQ